MTSSDLGGTATPAPPPVNPAHNVKASRLLLAFAAILSLIIVDVIHFIPVVAQLGKLGHDGGYLIGKLAFAIILIIAVGRLGGWLAGRLSQPRVVGEMVAGIALGPSILGQFLPRVQHWIFPSALIPHLNLMAQLTIIVFVFLLGANLPLRMLRGSGRQVVALGIGMVAVPVTFGILLASGMADVYRPAGVPLLPFLLFVGVSLGVTAFPVLVRILNEHELTNSKIGALGLATAGIGDVIAWCLLIVSVAAIHGNSIIVAARTGILLIIFTVAAWKILRPALRQFLNLAEKNVVARVSASPILLLSALGGAFTTDQIGVHAIFGAFITGLATPRDNPMVKKLTNFLDRGISFVIPLFFAVVGLGLQIDFMKNSQDLLFCGLVLVVAIVSKIGTTALIARLTKLTWRESVGLGVMMNCRGLTEFVVIATGLSLGIIDQNLFAIFVVMTLVTTMMTGPLLGRLKLNSEKQDAEESQDTEPDAPAPHSNSVSSDNSAPHANNSAPSHANNSAPHSGLVAHPIVTSGSASD